VVINQFLTQKTLVCNLFSLYSYEQDIRRGLQSIRRIIKDHNITGVHGPLAELLECEEKFFTALEVTAGNRYSRRLCFYICDSAILLQGSVWGNLKDVEEV
jgi:hypothetical protein